MPLVHYCYTHLTTETMSLQCARSNSFLHAANLHFRDSKSKEDRVGSSFWNCFRLFCWAGRCPSLDELLKACPHQKAIASARSILTVGF